MKYLSYLSVVMLMFLFSCNEANEGDTVESENIEQTTEEKVILPAETVDKSETLEEEAEELDKDVENFIKDI